jgi:hypothetical protein
MCAVAGRFSPDDVVQPYSSSDRPECCASVHCTRQATHAHIPNPKVGKFDAVQLHLKMPLAIAKINANPSHSSSA